MKYSTIFLAFFISLLSCSKPNKSADPTEAEILELAKSQGEEIATKAQKALGGQLKKVMLSDGPVEAVKFCNLAASPILDSLQVDMPAQIGRVSSRTRNPNNTPNDIETKILRSFELSIQKMEKPGAVVQILSDDQVLFAKPILLNNPLCLNCHGEAGTQIAEETITTLKELYPTDKATGHQMGDLRGMWTIEFEKKNLIRFLEEMDE
jgi:cytochrome c